MTFKLPEPFRKQGQQLCNDGNTTVFFDAYTTCQVLEAYQQGLAAQQPAEPAKEADAFEAWATQNKYDMSQHPLHWLFLNAETYAARQGWKAGIAFAIEHGIGVKP